MLEVTINCPDLAQALNNLATALSQTQPTAPTTQIPPAASTVPVQPPEPPAAVPSTYPPAPVTPAVPPVAPMTPPAAVPVTPAPGFTVEQIAKAGADLIGAQPAKMTDCQALMQRYGIAQITQLRPDQLGAFATELRGLGARI